MPNWKKVIVSGSDASLNSLIVKNDTTLSGSLYINAAQQAGGNNNLLTWNPTTGLVTYSTGSIVLTGSISGVDYIDFNTAANPSHLEGRIHWDSDTKTIQIDTDRVDFSIDAGHQSVVRVYNDTGADITAGKLVYINGAQGNTPTVATASWEIDPSSAGTIGFAATLIPGTGGNRHGYVVTSGLLTNINTNGFAVGTRLYLSSSGQFTNVIPDAPLHEVRLGVVVVNNATTGVIFVSVVNGFELTELHDVRTTTESNGDLLMYSSSLWINTKQLTGSYGLTGSLTATSFTGSLLGTASYATLSNQIEGGTQYRLPVWTSATTLGTSSLYESGSVLKSVYGGNDIGLRLDFSNNIYNLGTDSLSYGIGGFWVDTNFCNTYVGDGSNNYLGVNLQVNNTPEIIKTQFQGNDIGLKLDFSSSKYELGQLTGGNLTRLTIDDPTNTVSISGSTTITGSLTVITGSSVELQVTDAGVKLGNSSTDTIQITGSASILSGSIQAPYKSPYTSKSAAYTASIFDSTIEYTSGTTTLTLYTATGHGGRQLYVKNDGNGVITVDASGSQTIDGQLTRTLAQYEDLLIQADGTSNWIILNRKPVTMHFEHLDISPADATTYYIGNYPWAAPPSTSDISRQVRVTTSGWIRYITVLVVVATTLGTSEDSTLVIRNVTTATSSTVTTTLEHNAQFQNLTFTLATPLQVTRGDLIEFRWTTPSWGTNPTAVRHLIHALVE